MLRKTSANGMALVSKVAEGSFRAVLTIVLLATIAGSPFWARAQKAPANVAADLPAGTMQAKATSACLECHEARIILQQRLSKAAWAKEVDNRDALIDYLSINFSPDKPPYEPQRTDKHGAGGTSK